MTTPTHILAIIDFFTTAASVAKTVLADGKVNLTDLVTLAKLWAPAKAALEALSGVQADVSNIDADAIAKLATAFVNCVAAWMQVVSSGALHLA